MEKRSILNETGRPSFLYFLIIGIVAGALLSATYLIQHLLELGSIENIWGILLFVGYWGVPLTASMLFFISGNNKNFFFGVGALGFSISLLFFYQLTQGSANFEPVLTLLIASFIGLKYLQNITEEGKLSYPFCFVPPGIIF